LIVYRRKDCGTAYNLYTGTIFQQKHLFLRPFKGVHKDYLPGYIAVAEFRRNLKRISPSFISSLVKVYTSCR